jgi:small-conductance mechanosensitive channel
MSWTIEVDSVTQLLAEVGEYLLSISGSVIFIALLFLLSRLARTRFRAFAERRRMHRSVPDLFDNAVTAVVYVIVGFIILAALGVNTRSLATFAGLVTAALTLSLQDVFRNIFCGFYLLAERPFTVGDRIRIGAEDGNIERVDLRLTRIRNDRQELVLVPNSLFFSQVSIARSTWQARALTVQVAGIEGAREDAEERIRTTIDEVVSGSSAPAVRLLKVGPAGSEFEVTVNRVEVEDEERIVAALRRELPTATLSIVVR